MTTIFTLTEEQLNRLSELSYQLSSMTFGIAATDGISDQTIQELRKQADLGTQIQTTLLQIETTGKYSPGDLSQKLYAQGRPLGYVQPWWVREALYRVCGEKFPHPDQRDAFWELPTAAEEKAAIEWLRKAKPEMLNRIPASLLGTEATATT